jgi:hypothetical protein
MAGAAAAPGKPEAGAERDGRAGGPQHEAPAPGVGALGVMMIVTVIGGGKDRKLFFGAAGHADSWAPAPAGSPAA